MHSTETASIAPDRPHELLRTCSRGEYFAGELHHRYGVWMPAHVVRPDGYIGFRSQPLIPKR
jgi:hypothetical protein